MDLLNKYKKISSVNISLNSTTLLH